MTRNDFLRSLEAAGFSYRGMWSARSGAGKYDDVFAYTIYAPDGALLTSIIVRSFEANGIATYYANESNAVGSDLAFLRMINEQRLARHANQMTAAMDMGLTPVEARMMAGA